MVLAVLFAAVTSLALGDTFGSGANTFNIDFVTIGNPGNAADTRALRFQFGSVPYTFRMGQYEISEQMINKANAEGGLGITKDTRGPDKPSTSVPWNEAARFVNWLNTSSGSPPAYKFAIQPGEPGYVADTDIQLWTPSDAGYDPNNLYRNGLARYFLPSVDEWYKAAYYDPNAGVYFDYPTGSDAHPTPVASGTAAGTVVFAQTFSAGPADITLAGGLSPYGTMGQGGNVWEWEETAFDLTNNSSSSARGVRGGRWNDISGELHALIRFDGPSIIPDAVGFRVASSIPEPSTLLLAVSVFALLAPSARHRRS
jgi:hypothetical protein